MSVVWGVRERESAADRRERLKFEADMDARREPCDRAECERFICWKPCCFPPRTYREVGWNYCHRHRLEIFPRPGQHAHRWTCRVCGREQNRELEPEEGREQP